MAGRRGVLREGQVPPFRVRPWQEIRDDYRDLGWPGLNPLVDIVESVIDCGGADRLVATTSMHDLWVTRRGNGLPASSVDLVKVAAFNSVLRVPRGEVLIVHTSNSGKSEEISRPASEAVALFWRFTKEKWGIEPWRWDTMSEAQCHVLLLASERAGLHEPTWPSALGDADGLLPKRQLGLRHARAAAVELLRLGIVQLVVAEDAEGEPLGDYEVVRSFGAESAWRDPGATPQVCLSLTTAGERWYVQECRSG